MRPARKTGPGALRLSGAGLGSPRGDRAPERSLFAALAALRTSFQPPPAPTPGLRAGPVCFSSPAPSAQTRKQPWGRRQRLQASGGGWCRSAGPAGSGLSGEGALGPLLGFGGRGQPAGEVASPGAGPWWAAKAQVLGSEGEGWPARGPGPSPSPRPAGEWRRFAAGGERGKGPHLAWTSALSATPGQSGDRRVGVLFPSLHPQRFHDSRTVSCSWTTGLPAPSASAASWPLAFPRPRTHP